MAAKKSAKRPSGPSGANQQRGTMLREGRPGQFEEWREAAVADGRTLSGWIRFHLDHVVEAWKRTKRK